MAKRTGPLRGFLDRPNDDRVKTFGVAIAVGFVCALTVSFASVALRPLKEANIAAAQAARMAALVDRLPGLREVMLEAGVTALETRMVDLATGRFVPDSDPALYDFDAAIAEAETSIALPEDADPAGLRRRPDLVPVYLLERDGGLVMLVLPMRGTGYAGTIRILLALAPDLRTIAALTVLEQSETPGLGARIADPDWQAQWDGKQITDDGGTVRIAVVRGGAETPFEVDALSGATRTSNAMQNMMRFWLGPLGYGPFLDRLRNEGL